MLNRVTLAALLLCSPCGAQQEDFTSIRLLAENLHRAFEAKDLAAIDALWSDGSAAKASHHAAAERLLANPRIAAVHESTASDPQLADGKARLRVDREVVAAPGITLPEAGRQKLILEWVKDSAGWRISREIPAGQDLAVRLAADSTPGGSDSLLAANADLVDAGLAAALAEQGASARNRGDMQTAHRVLDLARSVADRVGSVSGRASALNALGLVYADEGDYPAALENYRASLDLDRQAHDDAGAARVFVNLSALHSLIGDPAAASDDLRESLAIAEKLQDKRLTTDALGSMGILHARRGDYLHAMALLQQCRELLQDGGDRRSLAATFNNIGNVYLWQGDLDQAREYFERELEVAANAGLKPLIAVAWMGLGRVAEFRGELRPAIANYEKSLAVLNETGNKPFAASDLTFMGSAYSDLGDQEKAIEYFQKGLEIQKSVQMKSEAALTLARIAEVYNRRADFPKALQAAGEAREMANSAGLREAAWRADVESGRAAQGMHENAGAEQHFRNAIALIEELRQDVAGGEAEQEDFFESKLEPYHRLVALLIAGRRTGEAFEYAERAKARVLTDVLRNGKAELSGLMSAEERARDQGLRIQAATLNGRLQRAQAAGSRAQVSEITAQLTRARTEYENFRNELYVRHPRWKSAGGAVTAVRIEEALAVAGDPNTAFLEFVSADDSVSVFALQPGRKPTTYSIPLSRAALAKRVELFRRQLAARDLGFRSASSALYQELMAPAGIDFAGLRSLVIVPDGALWELPFQALSDANGKYLLDDCAISYAPSMTALKMMTEVKRRRKDTPAGIGLLAMGDPVLERRLEGQVKALYRDETLALPAAKAEVQNLGRIYGKDSRIYVGADARESRFKAEAENARVLHLATHAVLNNASPLYSYLLLAGEQGGTEDGLLEAHELLTMNLRAELAVLSACETARGYVGAGEGIIGLSWALLVAGVPSTVLSQWKVASESTSILMTAFHQNRTKGMSDAEALRAAARDLRKNPGYQHPFYWAPFTLIGAGLN